MGFHATEIQRDRKQRRGNPACGRANNNAGSECPGIVSIPVSEKSVDFDGSGFCA